MSRDLLSLDGDVQAIQKPVLFQLVKKNHRPALAGRYYPSQKRMPHEEIIFDPTTNSNRTIRYAPSEQSIYKDEQPTKVVLGDIVFQNGSLVVPHTNPLLIRYLEKSNYNQGNPNRVKGTRAIFKVIDHEADAKKLMEVEVSQIQAANAVLGMEFSDLKAYARVLGVNINKSTEEIRHDMLVLSKKDPVKFMAGMDDPVVKRQQVIMDAMSYHLIEANKNGISWVLGDKKNLIVPVPIGQSPVAWFAEWTMSEKDGEKVYEEIEKKLRKLSE